MSDTPKIRIVQCLCPQRHCIMGIAYIPGVTKMPLPDGGSAILTADNAMQCFEQVMEHFTGEKGIDHWCGICHSHEFHYEDGETRFTDIREAHAEMRKIEIQNVLTGLFLRAGRN